MGARSAGAGVGFAGRGVLLALVLTLPACDEAVGPGPELVDLEELWEPSYHAEWVDFTVDDRFPFGRMVIGPCPPDNVYWDRVPTDEPLPLDVTFAAAGDALPDDLRAGLREAGATVIHEYAVPMARVLVLREDLEALSRVPRVNSVRLVPDPGSRHVGVQVAASGPTGITVEAFRELGGTLTSDWDALDPFFNGVIPDEGLRELWADPNVGDVRTHHFGCVAGPTR